MAILPITFLRNSGVSISGCNPISYRSRGINRGGDGMVRDMRGRQCLTRGTGSRASRIPPFHFASCRMRPQ